MEFCGNADLGYLSSKQMSVCFLEHPFEEFLLTGRGIGGMVTSVMYFKIFVMQMVQERH